MTAENPQIGDRMKDGSVYVGPSPDTGKPLFAMPADCALTLSFNAAAQYAEKLNAEKALGHDDWRVPTKAELNTLYQNRDAGGLKGSFKKTFAPMVGGWYWSSTAVPYAWPQGDCAWAQNFEREGSDFKIPQGHWKNVRFVR